MLTANEIVAARRVAERVVALDGATAEEQELAKLLAQALDHIEMLSKLIPDPVAARMAARGHRYPALREAGLGHLWVGPGFNDFAEPLILAVQKHLRGHDRPAQRGHACDYIRNRIKEADWGALEQRWNERHHPTPTRTAVGTEAIAPAAGAPPPPPYGSPAYWAWAEDRQRQLTHPARRV